MLPTTNIQSIVGATLYGRDRVKIGRIDQVLVDAVGGHPTWAVAHGGLFGRTRLFVPLDDATWEHDDVFVEFDKDDVKNAPHPDGDGGLSPEEEQELRAHFAARGGTTHQEVSTPVASSPIVDGRPEQDGPQQDGPVQDGPVQDGPGHAGPIVI